MNNWKPIETAPHYIPILCADQHAKDENHKYFVGWTYEGLIEDKCVETTHRMARPCTHWSEILEL